LTRSGTSPPQFSAVRKDHSITSSVRSDHRQTACGSVSGSRRQLQSSSYGLSMPFDNHCLTLAICFSAAQLRETRQTPVNARCGDYGRGEAPKAPRNVPPAHQMSGPALCRARTNSREGTRGRGLREPRQARATCCWRDRQPCFSRAKGLRSHNVRRTKREFTQYFNGFPKMTFASSIPPSPARQSSLHR
jgi:hypothetical protein